MLVPLLVVYIVITDICYFHGLYEVKFVCYSSMIISYKELVWFAGLSSMLQILYVIVVEIFRNLIHYWHILTMKC